jgi:hypothetical protein
VPGGQADRVANPPVRRGALGLDGGNLCPPVRGRAGTWDVFDRRKQRHDAIQAQALDRPLAFVLFLVAKPGFAAFLQTITAQKA